MRTRPKRPRRADRPQRWQAEAYLDGLRVADWGATESLLTAAEFATDLRREFPAAIVAIVPARY